MTAWQLLTPYYPDTLSEQLTRTLQCLLIKTSWKMLGVKFVLIYNIKYESIFVWINAVESMENRLNQQNVMLVCTVCIQLQRPFETIAKSEKKVEHTVVSCGHYCSVCGPFIWRSFKILSTLNCAGLAFPE